MRIFLFVTSQVGVKLAMRLSKDIPVWLGSSLTSAGCDDAALDNRTTDSGSHIVACFLVVCTDADRPQGCLDKDVNVHWTEADVACQIPN